MNLLLCCIPYVFLILSQYVHPASAWDSDQLHVFDVVEEVKQNFYELLDVPVDADLAKIKKAFRKLSLVLHPDKNDAPDAEIKFRQLVSVYDILRDSNKRSHYNHVLENGLPDWRSAVYYFRRVRRMGLAEMSVILFLIISVGQYLVAWASYAEKQFTLNEMRSKKQGRKPKKNKGGPATATECYEEYLEQMEPPSLRNTLPVQIPRLVWFLLVQAPPLVYSYAVQHWQNRASQTVVLETSSESELEDTSRGPRKRRGKFVLPELSSSGDTPKPKPPPPRPVAPTLPVPVSGGLWTDDDLLELIRLVKKYPQGTPNRWERIAEQMGRSMGEITFMANKIKEDGYKVPSQEEKSEINLEDDVKKVKRKADESENKLAISMRPWTNTEQKALENALKKYPKACVGDRWEKIANSVPDRSKEECVLRYKQLFKALKEKKENVEKKGDVEEKEDVEKKEVTNCDNGQALS